MKDGVVITKKVRTGGVRRMYLDANDFRKKQRSLKKYNMQTFKYLTFKYLKSQNLPKEDGHYIVDLPSSKEFEFVYGKVRLHYELRKGIMILENLEPQQFLIDGYMQDLGQYRGMFYRNEADKKKIDFYYKLKEKVNV